MNEDDIKLKRDWHLLLDFLENGVGKRPVDLNAVLFLIGVQELGQGTKVFTKEQKQDLMHIAVCKVLSLAGYYSLEGLDQEGWPHWKLEKKLPSFDLFTQEKLLKHFVIQYFETELDFNPNENNNL
jgi:hypothetical protein